MRELTLQEKLEFVRLQIQFDNAENEFKLVEKEYQRLRFQYQVAYQNWYEKLYLTKDEYGNYLYANKTY